MKGELLTRADRADLKIIFAEPGLSTHYKNARLLYVKWADTTCSTKIPMNGTSHTLNIPETVDQLTNLIRNFDGELKQRLAVKKVQEQINMNHERVCRLFAMNVVAGEPVKP